VSYRLFIPGPVQVSDKTYQALTTPVVGHRSPEFVELYQSIQPGLQKLFYTQDPVYISTSSAWGVMEGSLRNLVRKDKKVLNCMNGAFSDKWLDVSKRCGKQAEGLQVEWGQAIKPEMVREALSKGGFDAITIIHNETSTGLMNPLAEIMEVVREFPEVISIVDTVSSFTTLPIEKDKLGIDVMLTGSQKALALPPGMALVSVSERARERAKLLDDRGYYFDLIEFQKNHEKGMTPSTPVIPHIFALKSKIEDIMAEGMEERFARHKHLNNLVHQWAADRGFKLFPEAGYESVGLTCIHNEGQVDIAAINKYLRQNHQIQMDQGYGKLKGVGFRISNMGDETEKDLQWFLDCFDEAIAATKS